MPEIDPAEARRRIDAGEAVLVVFAESEEWDAEHAPDALHRPWATLDPAEFAGPISDDHLPRRRTRVACRRRRFTRPASMPSACTVACGPGPRTAGRSCVTTAHRVSSTDDEPPGLAEPPAGVRWMRCGRTPDLVEATSCGARR